MADAFNQEVEEHRVGVTFTPGDPQSLALAIKKVAIMPRIERNAIVKHVRHLAETTYSSQRINSRYNEMLRDALLC